MVICAPQVEEEEGLDQMRILMALSAVFIGSNAVAADAIHLNCTGTVYRPGFNNNVPYSTTVSVVIHPDFVEGSDGLGGQIVQMNERNVVFMGQTYVASTSDNWKTSAKRDVCIYGTIDRTNGKTGISSTYGNCKRGNTQPPQGPRNRFGL